LFLAEGKEDTMLYPMLTVVHAKARHSELLREAEFQRLVKEAKAGRPSLQDRLLLSVGDVLISFGLWLKARCQPDSAMPILRVG
jgi:hypothetical protein